MYLFKNAFKNITRSIGRNILIGIIITVITICTCVGLAIHKAGSNLVNTYKETNPLAVSFNLDMGTLRNTDDDTKNNFESLTVENVKNYGDSDLVKDYYYTLESSLSSSTVTAVSDNERPTNDESPKETEENVHGNKMANMGDFRITAYSNFAYLTDFSEGTKKITDGVMVTGSSDEDEIVISKDLAEDNELSVGDEVTFYLPSDTDTTFTYKIIGIYEDSSDSTSSNFMNISALNATNQIYANLNSVQKVLDADDSDSTKLVASNGLTAKYYLNNNDDLEKFEKEARNKGLSDYYSTTTNEEEIVKTLQPIQNVSSFSMNFLIVIIIIGAVVLSVINFLNIRDRKYEIGVLRAIGMSKIKVTFQLVLEIFFVAIASLVIGTGIGVLVSQPVTNKMLASEISSYTEQSTTVENNFGSNNFEKPSGKMPSGGNNHSMGGNKEITNSATTNYVDHLKVKIDFITIVELFGISILLTVISGGVASIFINKYNPNRILQDRV